MTRLLASVIALAAVLAGGEESRLPTATHQTHADILGVWGQVDRCSVAAGGIELDVSSSGRRTTYRVSSGDLPFPSEDHRKVVLTHYSILGQCPHVGDRAFITLCEGCGGPAIVAIEVEDSQSESRPLRPVVLRQYFDLEARNRVEESLVRDSALAVTAKQVGSIPPLWIRGRLREVMWTYETTARAALMIEKYGRPDLAQTIGPLRAVFDRYGATVGLVKAQPYINRPSRAIQTPTAAFVGYWGYFVAEVWVEQGHELTRVF